MTGRVLVSTTHDHGPTDPGRGCRRGGCGALSRVCGCGCGLMSRVSLGVIALVIATGGTSGPEGYPEVLAPGIPEKPDRAAQCGHQASSLVEISLLADVRRVSTAGHPGRSPRGAGGFVAAWGLGAELSGGWV